jgi:hypothetical protein
MFYPTRNSALIPAPHISFRSRLFAPTRNSEEGHLDSFQARRPKSDREKEAACCIAGVLLLTEKRIPGFSGKFGNPGSPGTQFGVCTQTGFLLTHQEPGFLEFSKIRDPAPGPDLDENLGSDEGER